MTLHSDFCGTERIVKGTHTDVGRVETASESEAQVGDFILERNHRNVKNVTRLLSVNHT